MRKRTKITLLALCGILTSTTVSYHYAVHTSVCAAENILSVKVKEDAGFFVNQTITADQFDFSINGSMVNEQNITITPSIFTSEGTHEITITYTTKNAAYQQKMNIDVKNVAADHIELASDDITLVKNQTITVASLPEVYMFYTDGSKKVVTDYKTNMDWEKGILEISSSGVSIKKNVNIIDSKISYIQVAAKKSVVPADYTFVPADFEVTAYFTNGMSMIVNDYQIQPYTLVDGGETVITIKYMTVSSSYIVRGTAPLNTPKPVDTSSPERNTPKPADTSSLETNTSKPIDTSSPETNTSKPIDTSSPERNTTNTADTSLGTNTTEVNSNLEFNTSSKNVKYVDSVWVEAVGSSSCFYQVADKMNDKWKQFSGRIEFNEETKDSMLYIKYLDNSGHEVILQSEFFCIDKTKPKVNIKEGKKYTKNQKIIATDSISGVSKIKITGDANKTVKNRSVWKKEGKFTLTVTDKAGNISKVDFTLAKSTKKISVSYSVGKSWDELYFKSKVMGSNRSVKWSVSNKRIAEISKKGVLKAKKAGVCYVKCQLDQLTVKKKLKVSPDKYVIVY